MNYHLFLDESGDHNLNLSNPNFPVFTLCGVIINKDSYDILCSKIADIKKALWGDKKINLHSRDIRKCQNGFEILMNIEKKTVFYNAINSIMAQTDYCVISVTINKEKYKNKYVYAINVYHIALEFILERAYDHCRVEKFENGYDLIDLHIVAEKRGIKEDGQLLKYYNHLKDKGNDYVSSGQFREYFKSFTFESKKDDNCGLQFSDLIAYPIARHIIDPKKVNLAFDIILPKIYCYQGKVQGIKVFP